MVSFSGIVQALEQFRGGGVEAGVGQHQPLGLLAEHDVGRDVQVVAQRQVLPDHGDPVPGRASRVGRHRPAREVDLAGGGRDVAGDAADQGGLARAVLARQRDQLAAAHAQVDVVQRPQVTVAAAEAGHGQERRHVRVSCSVFRIPAGLADGVLAVWPGGLAAWPGGGGAPGAAPAAARAAPLAAPLTATREPVMPSLCGLNRALGHKVHPPCGPDQGFSWFLNVKPDFILGWSRGAGWLLGCAGVILMIGKGGCAS